MYHDVVKAALEKDGWVITDDPFRLKIGSKDLYVDLGAEKLLAAQKGKEKIAVEVKSFLSPSPIYDARKCFRTIYSLLRYFRRTRKRQYIY